MSKYKIFLISLNSSQKQLDGFSSVCVCVCVCVRVHVEAKNSSHSLSSI